jgi:hypothetical protein
MFIITIPLKHIILDPAVNCGLDFAKAYEMALAAHKEVLH